LLRKSGPQFANGARERHKTGDVGHEIVGR